MKVMFLSAWFPYPPDNGSRIRAYNLIKSLSARHEVFLVSLYQSDSEPSETAQLGKICTVVSTHRERVFKPGGIKSVLAFFSSAPRSYVDTYDPDVRDAVESAIAQVRPDVIVASTLGTANYVPPEPGIPTVLEQHNCEYAVLKRKADRLPGGLRRWRWELGWKKFARWEAGICRRCDTVTMVSESDRDLMLKIAPNLANMHVVPNGVDTDYYSIGSRIPDRNVLIYNGALTYGANLDAVRFFAGEVYPILANKLPDAKLVVTGRHEGVDLSGVADCPGIELAGYVPDIRDALRRSAACVVPLREGGGSRLKILEAMAAGVPVVSTRVGAEGIEARHEQEILLAESAGDLAESICRVVSDTALAESLTRAARTLVEKKYAWDTIGKTFVSIVESVATTGVVTQ